MEELNRKESVRLEAQIKLDRVKTQAERNRLGQFATPASLASDILGYAKVLLPSDLKIRFLDPAFGTGSFYSALLKVFAKNQVATAVGYEVDPLFYEQAAKIWSDTPLQLRLADFTRAKPPDIDAKKANLLVCNPPYVRHHYLSKDQKAWLRQAVERTTGVNLSGLAGFYCYFLLLSSAWMAKDALAGWLIPSEFMDVGYGRKVKEFLLDQITLLRVHRFDPTEAQFDDALVSSAVVWFKNAAPPASHAVEFTYGGTLLEPEVSGIIPSEALRNTAKWTAFPNILAEKTTPLDGTRLSDLFDIKRGVATGANKFFVLTPEEASEHRLPERFLKPILPSPRYLPTDEIEGDDKGEPLLESRRFLLSCDLPEEEVRALYPSLWRYLQKGIEEGISERYLCRHRRPWYLQEQRPPAPILCTYMNRRGSVDNGKLFRFVLNQSRATAPNVYLMLYPKPALRRALDDRPGSLREVWSALNSMAPETLLGEGRVYGGGLHKIEPKELGNTPADTVLAALPQSVAMLLNGKTPTLFMTE